MTDLDLPALRVARLRQYLEAALPRTDPELFDDLFRLLAPSAAEGMGCHPSDRAAPSRPCVPCCRSRAARRTADGRI